MINIGEELTLRVDEDCHDLTVEGALLVWGTFPTPKLSYTLRIINIFSFIGTNGLPNYIIDIVLQQVRLSKDVEKIDSCIGLTMTEYIELKYFHALGFNYLARDEVGHTVVFKDKPRLEEADGTLRYWYVSKVLDLDTKNRKRTELASYEFVQFKDEPVVIKNILKGYSIMEEKLV